MGWTHRGLYRETVNRADMDKDKQTREQWWVMGTRGEIQRNMNSSSHRVN